MKFKEKEQKGEQHSQLSEINVPLTQPLFIACTFDNFTSYAFARRASFLVSSSVRPGENNLVMMVPAMTNPTRKGSASTFA
ncbi:hypothetical protein Scep_005149 [Stephania cephalantha]|uniref:Uncharacterized protein n=1 Tax=Stephania cephalantha TaxID=152367 RepID=A0AAP0PX86_9MAGN